jgi:hypothetical protein
MTVPRGCLVIWLICLGCQTLPPLEPPYKSCASQQWELGQAAMQQGRADEAIRCYEQSLEADPQFTRNHLSLAAAYLVDNDPEKACTHLAEYVAANPDEPVARVRYAELLLRLRRLPEARTQFEQLVCDAQEHTGSAAPDLIQCHSRLMEIAEESKDAYSAHLQRGIGLFLVARERAELPNPDGDLPTESLFCKAAAELTLAYLLRPEEARPTWYLYQVWSRLGQRQPAVCRLREAHATAPFTFLTSAEQCALHLAYQHYQEETQRK